LTRQSEDIRAVPKTKFLGRGFQKSEHEQYRRANRQTHAQTDATECITSRIWRW